MNTLLARVRVRALALLVACAVLAAVAPLPAPAQTRITAPKEALGFNIGDDYRLATYTQLLAYWQQLARQSPRMRLDTIGTTAEGRPQLMAIISSPENLRNLARYRDIAQRLAHAEGLTDDQARALAKEGKAVVWIDGGLHATEVLGAAQLMETSYQLVSRNDEETNRILKDVIVVMVHANLDGMQMVSKCYMATADSTQRRTCSPRLYNRWAGHDDNRDFYMSNTNESQNMNKLMYWDWTP